MENSKSPFYPKTVSQVKLRDALCALTALNQDTVLLDYGNVVIQRNYGNSSKVRLLAGGVAGKDLSHAIFVGKGMLTAAILGEDTVPTSREILHTIKELNEGDNCGIFVIVHANTDLLNFGLAVDRANADCRTRVKILSIDDDRSNKKERYSCGFILMAKILGAMSEQGALFSDIYNSYNELVNDIVTVDLNYVHDADEEKHMLRQSIHLTSNFEEDVQPIFGNVARENLNLHHSVPLVALINASTNLERLSGLELVKQVIEKLSQLGICLVRLYVGNFVSTVEGTAYLTVMKCSDVKLLDYLDAPCNALGSSWRHVNQYLPEISLKNEIPGLLKYQGKQEIPLKGPQLGETQIDVLKKSVQFACDALISCERQLNTIDSEKSKGNVGTRLKNFAQSLNKKMSNDRLTVSCPFSFLKKVGIIAESAIGGNMGSIYGLFFESGANFFGELPNGEIVTPFLWARVLTVAVNSIEQYCNRENSEYTLFYPLKCCESAINKEIAADQSYLPCYSTGVSVAEQAAQLTKLPKCKYSDAGAHAVGIWLRAVFEAVKLMSVDDIPK